MIGLAGGILQGGKNVFLFKRIILDDFFERRPVRQEFQNIGEPQSATTDARPPAALFRIDGNSIQVALYIISYGDRPTLFIQSRRSMYAKLMIKGQCTKRNAAAADRSL